MFDADILTLIPQRPPFVMVGKLLYADAGAARTSFMIYTDNVFVNNGTFSEAGLMENMAQTAAAGAGYMARKQGKPVTGGYIGAVNDLEVFALPGVNDELITEVTIEDHVFDVTIIAASIRCGHQLIARCGMKIFINQK